LWVFLSGLHFSRLGRSGCLVAVAGRFEICFFGFFLDENPFKRLGAVVCAIFGSWIIESLSYFLLFLSILVGGKVKIFSSSARVCFFFFQDFDGCFFTLSSFDGEGLEVVKLDLLQFSLSRLFRCRF